MHHHQAAPDGLLLGRERAYIERETLERMGIRRELSENIVITYMTLMNVTRRGQLLPVNFHPPLQRFSERNLGSKLAAMQVKRCRIFSLLLSAQAIH